MFYNREKHYTSSGYYLDKVYLLTVYFVMAIQSFNDRIARDYFVSGKLKKGVGWTSIANVVKRKLDIIHYAVELDDLKAPPANRLEMLKGDLKGFYSIRINDQWRIVFKWLDSGPYEVRITDYH